MCNTLVNQGSAFKFSLTFGSFSFQMDNAGIRSSPAQLPKKKRKSPGAIQRDKKRRIAFLKRKAATSSPSAPQSAPDTSSYGAAMLKGTLWTSLPLHRTSPPMWLPRDRATPPMWTLKEQPWLEGTIWNSVHLLPMWLMTKSGICQQTSDIWQPRWRESIKNPSTAELQQQLLGDDPLELAKG